MSSSCEDDALLDVHSCRRIRCQRCLKSGFHYARVNLLLLLTIASVVLGLVIGFSVRNASQLAQELTSLPGELFLRSLKMMILPLIVLSLMSGLGSLDIRAVGSLGIRTLIFYSATTIVALCTGLLLVLIIRPGEINAPAKHCTNSSSVSINDISDTVLDLIRNLVPDNLVSAAFSQAQTQYVYVVDWTTCAESYNLTLPNNTNCSYLVSELEDYGANCTAIREKTVGTRDGINILGIIVFVIGFSIALIWVGEEGRKIIRVLTILNEAIMNMVAFIMWFSPIGIASIIAGKLMEVDDVGALFADLGFYMLTVLLGLFIHGFITLPLIYLVITRRNPLKLYKGVLQALLVAFGISSSAATLPVTMQCLKDFGFNEKVIQFMLPLGATVNMDGTALYEAVAAVFIAQLEGIGTSVARVIVIAITATAASIGAAPIPSAGLVTLIIVLTAIGLPAEDAATILVVDWLLDRFRTTINVFGDCVGVGVVSHLMRRRLGSPPTGNIASDSLSSSVTSPSKSHDRLLDDKEGCDERLCETMLSEIEPVDTSSMVPTTSEQQNGTKSPIQVESSDL